MTSFNMDPAATTFPVSNPTLPDGSTLGPAVQDLRDLIASRVNVRWTDWAASHPHLAQVIDRTALVESAAASLRDDPVFQAALSAADLNETQLTAAARVIDLVESLVGRILPL